MSLLIETLFFGYVVMGALLWILMLVAHDIRVQAGERLPMDDDVIGELGMIVFALIMLVTSWPFVPWKEVREDLDLVTKDHAGR